MIRRQPEYRDAQDKDVISKRVHFSKTNETVDHEEEPSPGALTKFVKNARSIEILQKKGIKSLFPIQYKTYHLLYQGQDIIAKDRTGSGKTLAFSLPIIERFRDKKELGKGKTPLMLVILPTRELAIQVHQEIVSLKWTEDQFRAVVVYGGSAQKPQIRDIQSGVDIIIGTPGRLIDYIGKDIISFRSLQVTIIDEADQMLKQGFQEDIEKIFTNIQNKAPKKTQNLLFSATIPSWVKNISQQYQDQNCKFIDLINSSENTTSKTIKHLSYKLEPTESQEDGIKKLIESFNKQKGRVIIFCETKREAITLSSNLNCIKSRALHGDIPQRDREITYSKFKDGSIRCIIATNVAARGLDFPDIELVIMLEPPKQIQNYVHRSGRTGRAGKNGTSIVMYNFKQERKLREIQMETKISFEKITLIIESNKRQSNNHYEKELPEKESNYKKNFVPERESNYKNHSERESRENNFKEGKRSYEGNGRNEGSGNERKSFNEKNPQRQAARSEPKGKVVESNNEFDY